MFWMFGRVIEQRLGGREFLLFYLAAIVFAGATWVVAKNIWLLSSDEGKLYLEAIGKLPVFSKDIPGVVGASGGVVAVFLAFVLLYPKETVYVWGLLAVPKVMRPARSEGTPGLISYVSEKARRPRANQVWGISIGSSRIKLRSSGMRCGSRMM